MDAPYVLSNRDRFHPLCCTRFFVKAVERFKSFLLLECAAAATDRSFFTLRRQMDF